MAEGGEDENIKKARKVQELFHGRFSEDEAIQLLENHEWEETRVVEFLLHGKEDELQDVLGRNADAVLGLRRDEVLRELARKGSVADETRMFACKDCDHVWWRRVPVRKAVSQCYRCDRKFYPVPRNDEWGWAHFECQCGHKFSGFGVMNSNGSPCYQCNTVCQPLRIMPPSKRNPARRSNKPHSCTGKNCHGGQALEPHEDGGIINARQDDYPKPRGNTRRPNRQVTPPVRDVCVHPKSIHKRVIVASILHQSTGSTVNTFLDQGDIDAPYEPSLASTREEDEY